MSTSNYLLLIALIFLTSYGVSVLMSRAKGLFSLVVCLLALLSFLLQFFINQSPPYDYFNVLKSFSVFVPVSLYAAANYWQESLKNRRRLIANFFSFILALNIFETALIGIEEGTWQGYVYAGLAIALSVLAFKQRWRFEDGILGFTNTAWTLSFGLVLSYLYLFMFPPGSGFMAWLILLICYLPFKHMGHHFFPLRAYSLCIYFVFIFNLDLLDSIKAMPIFLEEGMIWLQSSSFKEILLGLAIISLYNVLRPSDRKKVKMTP